MNKRWYYSFGIAIPLVAGALLLFGKDVMSTNLYNTGITPGIIFGILLLIETWWIFKHHV